MTIMIRFLFMTVFAHIDLNEVLYDTVRDVPYVVSLSSCSKGKVNVSSLCPLKDAMYFSESRASSYLPTATRYLGLSGITKHIKKVTKDKLAPVK